MLRPSNGRNMQHYQHLLAVAVDSITGKSEEKGVESLFMKGGTVLTATSSQGIEDFAVVTYLILVDPDRAVSMRKEASGMIKTFDDFLEQLDIPSSCWLDKPVFKKLFLDNGVLDATDKKCLKNDVARVRWIYTLKSKHDQYCRLH